MTEPDSPFTHTGRFRTVVAPDGRHWTVHEYESSQYDRRAGKSLIFVTDDAMRRVREYPADWFDLPGDALYALSFGR